MIRAHNALVRCSGLGLTFPAGATAVVAVRGASFDIFPASRIALMGPSGSGKSSLLHLLAGLETPTSGTLAGCAYTSGAGPNPSVIGLVFQYPSLIPALTAAENVALPLVLAGTGVREARGAAAEALSLLSLDWLGDKLPQELSGGQAQRVAVARVLACRPQLILADEPTGQLDQETGSAVIEVLLKVADGLHAGVVVATHDPLVEARFEERWRMQDGVVSFTAGPGAA